MASLFSEKSGDFRLLDPGAGVGALSLAFWDRFHKQKLKATLFEIDDTVRNLLEQRIKSARLRDNFKVFGEDFIEKAVEWLRAGGPRFTHVILNPPYKKIGTTSKYRTDLRLAGIETVNLYSAFTALSLALLEDGGELVAIIPRSFCNGPYYKPFRKFLLSYGAITHIHLFDARDKAFGEDAVLQENVIIAMKRGVTQGMVQISTSTDDTMKDYKSLSVSFARIVYPNDREQFIHIPTAVAQDEIDSAYACLFPLGHIGIEVSTGPVVDFRVKEYLRAQPERDTVPLLYPGHFDSAILEWPKVNFKKPNAIVVNDETWRSLYPRGFYTVVRRFSSKEEKRRIVASVVDPDLLPHHQQFAFENHLNVFHRHKRGLSPELAFGLAAYLNTELVDQHFRKFNGHTQVNATDLRMMRYPTIAALEELGIDAMSQSQHLRTMGTAQLEGLLA